MLRLETDSEGSHNTDSANRRSPEPALRALPINKPAMRASGLADQRVVAKATSRIHTFPIGTLPAAPGSRFGRCDFITRYLPAAPESRDISNVLQPQDEIRCMDRSDLRNQASHFEFGKNWLDYAEKIDEGRIEQASKDLLRLAGVERLDGLRFFDIGCGSGLFALAAARAGASEVLGIDIDPDSVTASKLTLERHFPAARATFSHASIFDISPDDLGTFDVVYSWGVLHHTGDMETAIKCASKFVRPGGLFLVALYRKTPFCAPWRVIKRWYSNAEPAKQNRVRSAYLRLRRVWATAGGQDFDRYVREYPRLRGMDFYNDVHDWLGGFPYESISASRCCGLMSTLGFQLQYQHLAHVGKLLPGFIASGCSEFAFRRAK